MNQIHNSPGIPLPARQYRFHPIRRWQADFAWVDQRIMVEVEGGIFVNGRHTTGGGYEKDCEKYNSAVLLGWKIFRFTPYMVRNKTAINLLVQIFSQVGSETGGDPGVTEAPPDTL